MSEREYKEWAGLWEALFGEPPPIAAEVSLTATVLIQCLPSPGAYEFKAEPPRS